MACGKIRGGGMPLVRLAGVVGDAKSPPLLEPLVRKLKSRKTGKGVLRYAGGQVPEIYGEVESSAGVLSLSRSKSATMPPSASTSQAETKRARHTTSS
jgi:hypothetical protein